LYDIDLLDYLNEGISVESKIVFGENADSLTKLLTGEIIAEIIAVEDNSQIKILSAEYNKKTGKFEITIKNTGEDIVHVDPEITDIIIADEKTTIGGEQQRIKPGKESIFKIKALLKEADFEDNQKIKVYVRYGAHKDVLLKLLTQEFDLVVKKYNYKLIVFIVVVLILIKLIMSLRKKRTIV
jgi:archaellum component FlaG (FlaF/FlaG flagellin family)